MTTSSSIAPGAPPNSSNQTPKSSLLGSSSDTNVAASQLSSNFDNFLKLLTTQLSNQDPLSPLDATQFTTQLAQFSNVEQAVNTNKKLDTLISLQGAGQFDTGVSFLGKMVEAPGDTSSLSNGQAEWGYFLPSAAKSTQLQIYNSDGTLVRTIPGETAIGPHQLKWDGKDTDGNALPDGNYQVKVVAKDADGKDIAATTNSISPVTGVLTQNGVVFLQTAGGVIQLGDVVSVREPPPAPAS
jgi:flagellar basal-body rod modification protein FlgD